MRHKHKWVEFQRTFTGKSDISDGRGFTQNEIERIIWGITTIELKCSECGDRDTYTVKGDAR